ncbi:MAG: hypothetical protein F6K21_15725 [Symploca sp. SIO2D2]|nr:hypothetical protein [Symploca sp. SIO2D2]
MKSQKIALEKISRIIDCEHKTAPSDENGEYYLIGTSTLRDGVINLDDANRVSYSTYLEWTKRRKPQAGDIIISREAPVGEVGLIKEEYKVCLGQRTVLIQPKRKTVNSSYLLYFLNSIQTKDEFSLLSTGSVVPRLNLKDLRGFRILLPSISEQKAIAQYLDTQTAQIDCNIDLLTQKAQRYEELKRSLINETVTRGLDKSVPIKDSSIEWTGQIPEHWNATAVKRLARNQDNVVQTGPFGAQLHASDYVDEGVPLILIRNVKELWIDDTEIPKITHQKAELLSIYCLEVDDIVFSRVGSIGRIALISEREKGWMISGQMLRLRIKNNLLNKKYLIYAFSSEYVKSYISLKSLGSTRESINTEILSNCILLVPTYDEQIKIADYLDTKTVQIDQII